jgi:hypothetical protein
MAASSSMALKCKIHADCGDVGVMAIVMRNDRHEALLEQTRFEPLETELRQSGKRHRANAAVM